MSILIAIAALAIAKAPPAGGDWADRQLKSFAEQARAAMADERFDEAERCYRIALALAPKDAALNKALREAEWARINDEMEQSSPDQAARLRRYDRCMRWGLAALAADKMLPAERHFRDAANILQAGDPDYDRRLAAARGWRVRLEIVERSNSVRLPERETWDWQFDRVIDSTSALADRSRRVLADSLDTLWRGDPAAGVAERGLWAHPDGVAALAIRPDGGGFATAGRDGERYTVKLWAGFRGESKVVVEHVRPILALGFGAGGRHLVMGRADGRIGVWDFESKTPTMILQKPGNTDVLSVAFDPEGKEFASGGWDRRLRTWSADGDSRITSTERDHPFLGVAMGPRALQAATADGDGNIALWNLTKASEFHVPLGKHEGQAHAVAFRPDGTMLASAGSDKLVRLWDVAERKPAGDLTGHYAAVRTVAFSPDGAMVAAGAADGRIVVWSLKSRTVIWQADAHPGKPVTGLAFTDGGWRVVTAGGDGFVRTWSPWRQPAAKSWPGFAWMVEVFQSARH